MSELIPLDISRFRVPACSTIVLREWPTAIEPLFSNQEDYKQRLALGTAALHDLQRLLYADGRHALLVIFQAMDAAGKDSAIRHVLSGVNPQGCQVHSFRHPSAQELDHDFLWRTHRALPARGHIGVFNRSYYEEVLIARVQPEILEAQRLPDADAGSERFWADRYRSIVDAEAHLDRNGTSVVKIFLHLSKAEQRQRLLARIDNPDKAWKFSDADLAQREAWDAYMSAYETCLSATSNDACPWYAVPADSKKNARLIVSAIIRQHLEALDLHYPVISDSRRLQLLDARAQLERDS